MKKDKIMELDFLRTIAFLAVVMQHVLGSYLNRPGISTTDHILIGASFGLFKFAVPLFVFISGLVLFYNYFYKLKYSRFLKNRIFDILIPYVLFSFFYTLWESKNYSIFNLQWLIQFGKSLILGNARYHLWYVVMIFQAIIILPVLFIIIKWLQKKIHTTKGFAITFTLFTLAYLLFVKYYYDIFCHTPIPRLNEVLSRTFSINFLSYIFYFILGGICGLYYERWRAFVIRFRLAAITLSIALYLYVEYVAFTKDFSNGVMTLDSFGSLNLRFFLFTTFSIIALYGIALYLADQGTPFDKAFIIISIYSFDAYLVHAYVLSTRSLSLATQTNITNYLLFYLILFSVSSLMSVVIGYLFRTSYMFVLSNINNLKKHHNGI